jgi:predicted histone-like DNA-binding protein
MQIRLIKKNVLLNSMRVLLWYAIAVLTGRSTLEMIAQAIAAKTTLTPTDVKAVLDALWREIIERLRMGHIVELGPIGNFQLIVRNKRGTETREEWSKDLIESTPLQYHPTKEMKEIMKDVPITMWKNYEEDAVLNAVQRAERHVRELEEALLNAEAYTQRMQMQVAADPSNKSREALLKYALMEMEADKLQLEDAKKQLTEAQEHAARVEADLNHTPKAE